MAAPIVSSHAHPPTGDEVRSQVEKILQSSRLRNAELLRHLLAFLTDHAVTNPGILLRERTIAEQVFGRTDFDPQENSVVRVHIGRLRSRLAEYYQAEGADDHVILQVPRGGYSLACHIREQQIQEAPATVPQIVGEMPQMIRRQRIPYRQMAAVCVVAICAAAIASWWSRSQNAYPPEMRTFWQAFLRGAQEPLVVFANALFVGSELTGMRQIGGAAVSTEGVVDTYTGVGVVMATQALTRNFTLVGRSIRVKSAQLLTWDDARDSNLIFLGSPESNTALRQLPHLQYFNFKDRRVEPNPGNGAIVNEAGRAGEQRYYFDYGPANYRTEYAVLALEPGMTRLRRTLILAGITTHGTQAAAEFVCRPDAVAELLSKLGVSSGAEVPFFEALLELNVRGGVPLQARVVLLRPFTQ